MSFTRADATTLKNLNGEHVQVVGTLEEFIDPKTVKIQANGPITAHMAATLDSLEAGEAYALIAVVKDDETINVNHAIHIPQDEYDADLVTRVVAAQTKHADFFKPRFE